MKKIILLVLSLLIIFLIPSVKGVVTDDLIQYYNMNDGNYSATQVFDVVNYAQNLSIMNETGAGVPGYINASYYFDGNHTYLESSSTPYDLLANNGNFSICVWFNTSNYNDFDATAIWGQRVNEDNRWGLDLYGNFSGAVHGVRIFVREEGVNIINLVYNTEFQNNIWYHYCMVRNGSNFTFYIDGVFNDTQSDLSTTSSNLGINWIGRLNFGGGNQWEYYEGKYDELAVWNRTLSDDEVFDVYNSTTGYPFDSTLPPSPDNITGAGLADRIAIWIGESNLSYDTNLYWDFVNHRLGIGTTSPSYALSVNGNVSADYFIGDGSLLTGISAVDTQWPLLGVYLYNLSNQLALNETKLNETIDARIGFPSPNYDSGWVNMSQGESKYLTHNLGGAVDDYVVDVSANSATYKVNQINYGTRQLSYGVAGYRWENLNITDIKILRTANDVSAEQIRVRIWTY